MAGGVPRPSGKTAPAEKPGEGGWVAGPSAILRRTKDCTNERRQDYTVCRLGKSRSASIPLAEIGGQALPKVPQYGVTGGRLPKTGADDNDRLRREQLGTYHRVNEVAAADNAGTPTSKPAAAVP
jgi:hypothetical protein